MVCNVATFLRPPFQHTLRIATLGIIVSAFLGNLTVDSSLPKERISITGRWYTQTWKYMGLIVLQDRENLLPPPVTASQPSPRTESIFKTSAHPLALFFYLLFRVGNFPLTTSQLTL